MIRNTKLRVALVHDYLKEFGGAERVLEAVHDIWPDSTLYTAIYSPKYLGPHRKRFEKWKIVPSLLQLIPFKQKIISFYRFVDIAVFSLFNLKKYDVVIVSAAGSFSGVNFFRKSQSTLHVCYYHTPPRYLYGLSTAADWTSTWLRRFFLLLGRLPMHFLRKFDYSGAQKPDILIANSQVVAKRIKKFYGRESIVINPPLDFENAQKYSKGVKRSSFYLAGGRLARAKRIHLAIEACSKLGLPLKVMGKGFAGYGVKQLKKVAGSTIEFVGEVDDAEKFKLMAQAKAFIYPSAREDFGIMTLEAMATGTPVIAQRVGGFKETIVDGKNGVFFEKGTVDSLIKAIKVFEKTTIDPGNCTAWARNFSEDNFKSKMVKVVNDNLKKENG